ncbi:MAG: glycosyltransferase family 2 protein [Candidatus Binatia bacterium]
MHATDITPLVLSYNEEPNLRRTLERLTWAPEIVLLDSFSSDATLEIARSYPNVRIVQRTFDNHTAQWNFGLDQVNTDWVLALDADYVLSPELAVELQSLTTNSDVVSYYSRFRYCVNGRPLRGSLYPPRAVLFRRTVCRYASDGHTQLLNVGGPSKFLRGVIYHDDRKPLSYWLAAQERYARLEAEQLLARPVRELRPQDRIRRYILIAPLFVPFYILLGKGLILDGWRGWCYTLQRTYFELLLSLLLLEAKLLSCRRLVPPA